MKDWTDTTIHTNALAVDCPYCHAKTGEECRTNHGPLQAFPAHLSRIRNAQKAAAK